MLARTIPGGDIRAFQELVAAQALAAEPDEGAILDALIAATEHAQDHRRRRFGDRCGVQPRRAAHRHAAATTKRCGGGTPTPANPSVTLSPAIPTG